MAASMAPAKSLDPEMARYEPHPGSPTSSELAAAGILHHDYGPFFGCRVYSVEGASVRKIHLDFALGGNGGRYRYVPEHHLWVERGVTDPVDFAGIVLHEYLECVWMVRDRRTYDDAHDRATAIEKEFRRHAQDLYRRLPKTLARGRDRDRGDPRGPMVREAECWWQEHSRR